jgi:DinB superfamily
MPTTDQRTAKIAQIAGFPPALREAVEDLTDEQLDTPYRDGGWTVRQVVHHVADSHMSGYLRCRWTVAEDHTTLKTYDQDRWATFADSALPVAPSLTILDGLHERWVAFLSSLPDDAWSRTAIHPDRGEITLDDLLDTYSHHGANHVKQITDLRARKGW